jgi:hypothetical protein
MPAAAVAGVLSIGALAGGAGPASAATTAPAATTVAAASAAPAAPSVRFFKGIYPTYAACRAAGDSFGVVGIWCVEHTVGDYFDWWLYIS